MMYGIYKINKKYLIVKEFRNIKRKWLNVVIYKCEM